MTMTRSLVAAGVLLASATFLCAPASASTALTLGDVHLLAGPANTFGPAGDLPGNSKVGVLWCGPANFDWCLVQFHKKQGWLHSSDLSALLAGSGEGDTPTAPGAGPSGTTTTGGGGSGGGKSAAGTESRQTGTGGPSAGSVGSGGTKGVGAGL